MIYAATVSMFSNKTGIKSPVYQPGIISRACNYISGEPMVVKNVDICVSSGTVFSLENKGENGAMDIEEEKHPILERVASDKHFPCIMVIFGASGDLTRRKLMPALYRLEVGGLLDEHFAIVGFARTQKDHQQFRREMREAVKKFVNRDDFSEDLWERFSSRLYYIAGRYDHKEFYVKLHKFLVDPELGCGGGHFLYYLALPPDIVETVLENMREAECVPQHRAQVSSRIMIEKPFGSDVVSAQRINRLLRDLFDESQIYRIDHYLAKDTVRNLLVFRFTNVIFESLWNRNYIDNVQITAAEKIGIEGRGAYYEKAGVVRDMLQSHVMQVLALIAMEPPLAGDIESVRDKKVEVFKALAPIPNDDYVLGQYRGYRDEPKVSADSATPTFVALRLFIDNWRWQGVPFYVRSGKYLADKLTEVVIQFKNVPLCVLPNEKLCELVRPNTLSIRIQPDEGIRLSFSVQRPGREDHISTEHLDFRYSSLGIRLAEGYERVLLDGLRGSPALFWRADGIEAAWRAVEPLIQTGAGDPAGLFLNYEPGSWGPNEADELLRRDGKYWLPSS